MEYIQSLPALPRNLIKSARVYLNALEKYDKINPEVLEHYRKFLKVPRNRVDVYVPSDDEVLSCLNIAKENKCIELVYLVLMYSGIRLVEAIDFLSSYDKTRFKKQSNFVSYAVGRKRGQKQINTIYLPMFVYDKLFHLEMSYAYVRKLYTEMGGKMSLKYLRKWNFNMLLYKGVPESVADFIQGRSSGSIGASHYMAKSQQAEFWYGKVVEKFK